jgi:hypothetical protein
MYTGDVDALCACEKAISMFAELLEIVLKRRSFCSCGQEDRLDLCLLIPKLESNRAMVLLRRGLLGCVAHVVVSSLSRLVIYANQGPSPA